MDYIDQKQQMKCFSNKLKTICAPIFSACHSHDGEHDISNGTMFFLDIERNDFVLGVTANHVHVGLTRKSKYTYQILGEPFSPELIDSDCDLDIATFMVPKTLIRNANITPIKFNVCAVSASPKRIVFGGFPGRARRQTSQDELSFGFYFCGEAVASVRPRNISIQLNTNNWIDALGSGLPPDNYDLGGLSGGPVFIPALNDVDPWVLAGVIYQGPNPNGIPGFQVLLARRAHFINSDGTLNRDLWGHPN